MGPSVVQRNANASTGITSSLATAFNSNNTAGNAIVVIGFLNANITSFGVSDSQGNSYSSLLSNYNATDVLGFEVWIAYGVNAGANTVTLATGLNACNVHIFEVAGLNTTSAFDASNFLYQHAATTLTSNSAATTYPSELLIGASAVLSPSSTYSAGVGYSNLTTTASTTLVSASEEQTNAIVGSYPATFGLNTNLNFSVTLVITFGNSVLLTPVSDSTEIEEYSALEIPSSANPDLVIEDYITTSESVGYYSELVATRDSLNIVIPTLYIKESDSTVTSENITLFIPFYNIYGIDSTTTSESVTAYPSPLFINLSDSTVTSEAIALSITGITDPNLPVSDSTQTSENLGYYSELIATREYFLIQYDINIDLIDTTIYDENGYPILDENGDPILGDGSSSGDSTATSENVTLLIPTLYIITSDSTSIVEYAITDKYTPPDVQIVLAPDRSTLSETVWVNTFRINVNDLSVTSENFTSFLSFYSVATQDSTQTSEKIFVLNPLVYNFVKLNYSIQKTGEYNMSITKESGYTFKMKVGAL